MEWPQDIIVGTTSFLESALTQIIRFFLKTILFFPRDTVLREPIKSFEAKHIKI